MILDDLLRAHILYFSMFAKKGFTKWPMQKSRADCNEEKEERLKQQLEGPGPMDEWEHLWLIFSVLFGWMGHMDFSFHLKIHSLSLSLCVSSSFALSLSLSRLFVSCLRHQTFKSFFYSMSTFVPLIFKPSSFPNQGFFSLFTWYFLTYMPFIEGCTNPN